MIPTRLAEFLQPTLSRAGFALDEIQDNLIDRERDAWAVYFKSPDCKVQFYGSLREGGCNIMIAPVDAPNELAPANNLKDWLPLLRLSTADDNLETPRPGADAETRMEWLKSLFEVHIESARKALRARA